MANPKISVNKFCEYGRSPRAKRRKEILQSQKFPETGKGFPQYYSTIRKNVINYICSSDVNELVAAQLKLSEKSESTKWVTNDIKVSKALIEHTKRLDLNLFNDFDLSPCQQHISITIEGLKIKVNPDILIHREGKLIGGIKTHFGKTNALNQEARLDTALLIKESLMETFPDFADSLDIKLCLSIDIPSSKISFCRKAFKRRLSHVVDTASEIMRLWDSVKEDLKR